MLPPSDQVAPVTVIIPSYQRPGPLAECLRSLLDGTMWPAEIIVVGRAGDSQTEEALGELCSRFNGTPIKFRSAWVTARGHIPPVETGFRLASNEILVVLDDDITVSPDWLKYIPPLFSDPRVGVAGGRVVTPEEARYTLRGKPGRNTWYGKHWGNVGRLEGEYAIEVHAVMEGNSAWRRELATQLQFDDVLNFDDACMYGLDLCLQAQARGFCVLYEPRAFVYHHIVPRLPELDRQDRARRVFTYCRNYTYIMLRHLPWPRRLVFLGWWFLIGEREGWGLGSWLADILLRGANGRRQLTAALRGKVAGLRLWLDRRPRLLLSGREGEASARAKFKLPYL